VDIVIPVTVFMMAFFKKMLHQTASDTEPNAGLDTGLDNEL
jgi:hypothetical protein